MFENFSFSQMSLIYLGLKGLIESKSGNGFHNKDMGHPVYQMGSRGESPKETEYADSPDKNTLFKMLSEISIKMKDEGYNPAQYTWWYDFSTWENFCKFAVEIYEGKR
jgi:hypothetical protein